MGNKKTAKKPAKVLKKKRRVRKPLAPVKLTEQEIQQIKSDARRLFDIAAFGTTEPTNKEMGLSLIKERMKYGA